MINVSDYTFLLKILTLFLLTIRFIYWTIAERQVHKQKPKLQKTSHKEIIKRIATLLLGTLVGLQLLGLQILPYSSDLFVQGFGFLIVAIAFILSIFARKELGTNWTHAAEYQIKKNHVLVTKGIYKYVRHPIYTGMFLSCIGAELVAGSYLFVAFLLLLPFTAYLQAKREETILTEKFGDEYINYIKTTNMFIPYIW